ncbi:MAG: hypothetical protein LBU51_01995 [Bacteroidales bacterium]|jgi:hypothetical protein|nr:hypothetical protein [Bacteroidales bacterium]
MKSIEKIIKEVILKEKNSDSTISIDDSHFFAILLEKGNGKKLWNFVFLFVAFILCATILITSFVFFINDVLLFQNSSKINQAGAIIPERSCKRETAIFLFGSAQRWANTGIQLQKGDEVKISYSGSFHSDVAGLRSAVESNNTLRYKWISFSNEDTTVKPFGLLYSAKGCYFGSLLYVIAGEMGVNDNIDTNIKQVKQNILTKVEQNGILYLAVNDIYLLPKVIAHYDSINQSLFGKEIIDSIQFNSNKQKRDSADLFFCNDKKDSVYLSGTKFREIANNNKEVFYQDNIGEVLVVIDIKRQISPLSWKTGIYRWTEDKINKILDNWKYSNWLFVASFLLLIICIIIFRESIYKLFCNFKKKRK